MANDRCFRCQQFLSKRIASARWRNYVGTGAGVWALPRLCPRCRKDFEVVVEWGTGAMKVAPRRASAPCAACASAGAGAQPGEPRP